MKRIPTDRGTRWFAVLSCSLLLFAFAACSDDDDPTGPPRDVTAPTVIATNPSHNAVGVAVITASFSESLDPTTVSVATMTLTGPNATAVNGTVSYVSSPSIAEFTPSVALAPGTAYSATVTTGIEDLAGNALATAYQWTFTTAATSDPQTAPDLGAAADYAVLAGSTVTSTGATALTGDLGVSPGTSVTGFPPGTVTGTQHAGDSTAANAMDNLTTAYNDLAGRTLGPVALAGNLGGLTLPPGLYKSTSGLEISSGDLTLDAGGVSDAVFIFQIASTFTTMEDRSVILTGGAEAANVFWQVGSSATLGSTSTVNGTVMANQSISMATGAVLNGRALARIGGVSLEGNTIVVPAP
ncbi:MAG: ice-binding family protein [Candidatus Krumholzibacteriia bacterium]